MAINFVLGYIDYLGVVVAFGHTPEQHQGHQDQKPLHSLTDLAQG